MYVFVKLSNESPKYYSYFCVVFVIGMTKFVRNKIKHKKTCRYRGEAAGISYLNILSSIPISVGAGDRRVRRPWQIIIVLTIGAS